MNNPADIEDYLTLTISEEDRHNYKRLDQFSPIKLKDILELF